MTQEKIIRVSSQIQREMELTAARVLPYTTEEESMLHALEVAKKAWIGVNDQLLKMLSKETVDAIDNDTLDDEMRSGVEILSLSSKINELNRIIVSDDITEQGLPWSNPPSMPYIEEFLKSYRQSYSREHVHKLVKESLLIELSSVLSDMEEQFETAMAAILRDSHYIETISNSRFYQGQHEGLQKALNWLEG